MGTTDSTGYWSTSGQFASNDSGSWYEDWTVGGVAVSPAELDFNVTASGGGGSGSGPACDLQWEGLSEKDGFNLAIADYYGWFSGTYIDTTTTGSSSGYLGAFVTVPGCTITDTAQGFSTISFSEYGTYPGGGYGNLIGTALMLSATDDEWSFAANPYRTPAFYLSDLDLYFPDDFNTDDCSYSPIEYDTGRFEFTATNSAGQTKTIGANISLAISVCVDENQ